MACTRLHPRPPPPKREQSILEEAHVPICRQCRSVNFFCPVRSTSLYVVCILYRPTSAQVRYLVLCSTRARTYLSLARSLEAPTYRRAPRDMYVYLRLPIKTCTLRPTSHLGSLHPSNPTVKLTFHILPLHLGCQPSPPHTAISRSACLERTSPSINLPTPWDPWRALLAYILVVPCLQPHQEARIMNLPPS